MPACVHFDAADTLLHKNWRFAFIFSLGFSLCSLNFFYDCRYCFSTRVEFNPCQQAPQRGCSKLEQALGTPRSRAPEHRVKTLLEVDTASCMGVQRDAGQEQKASAHKRGLHGLKGLEMQKTSPWQQGHPSSGLAISNEVSPGWACRPPSPLG